MEETTANFSPSSLPSEQRELLDQLLDKWSLLLLDRLCERPHRFNELRHALPGVSQKSLTTTLRRLERNGMVERRVISDRPVAVEYRMSALGKTLRSLVEGLFAWADSNMASVERARDRFDQQRDGSQGVKAGGH